MCGYIDILHLIGSVLIAVIVALVTSYFNNRFFNRKFMLKEVYKIHRSLLKKLTLFSYQFEIIYDIEGYQFDEKVKENIKKGIDMKYQDYENELKVKSEENSSWPFSWVLNVSLISDHINLLERWIKDIEEISYLSNNKTRKIAKQIIKDYFLYKQDRDNLSSNLDDELGYDLSDIQKSYCDFKLRIYDEYFWIKIYPKIKKLQTKLEQFVALK